MQEYTGFASVYDLFMNNVPYEAWEERLCALLQEAGVRDGLVLELGCGTGIMTERMASRGYDMIGVDLSEDMLSEAMEKRSLSGHNILYLQQDMRAFELYGTVAAVYSVCDSLNYITEPEELRRVFELVSNYLDPGGVFVFDFNTPAAYGGELRRHPIVEEQEGITMIWENDYDPETCVNEHCLTFFVPMETEEVWTDDCDGPRQILPPQGEGEPVYVKEQEFHRQRAYRPEEIRQLLEEAGLEFCRACDAETGGEPGAKSERIFCVARECKKHGRNTSLTHQCFFE